MIRTWVACAFLVGISCAGCSDELSEKRIRESLHGCLGPEWPVSEVGPVVPNREGNEVETTFEFRLGAGQGVDSSISIPGRARYRRDAGGGWHLTLVTSKSHDKEMRSACVLPFEVE
jgi:hypothetical protein